MGNRVENYLTDLAYALDYAYNAKVSNPAGLTVNIGQSGRLNDATGNVNIGGAQCVIACAGQTTHTNDLITCVLKLRNVANLCANTSTIASTDVVQGHSAYNASGQLITGSIVPKTINNITMTPNGAEAATRSCSNISCQYPQVTIPKGCYNSELNVGFDLTAYNPVQKSQQQCTNNTGYTTATDIVYTNNAATVTHNCRCMKITTPQGYYSAARTLTIIGPTVASAIKSYSASNNKLAVTPCAGYWDGTTAASTGINYYASGSGGLKAFQPGTSKGYICVDTAGYYAKGIKLDYDTSNLSSSIPTRYVACNYYYTDGSGTCKKGTVEIKSVTGTDIHEFVVTNSLYKCLNNVPVYPIIYTYPDLTNANIMACACIHQICTCGTGSGYYADSPALRKIYANNTAASVGRVPLEDGSGVNNMAGIYPTKRCTIVGINECGYQIYGISVRNTAKNVEVFSMRSYSYGFLMSFCWTCSNSKYYQVTFFSEIANGNAYCCRCCYDFGTYNPYGDNITVCACTQYNYNMVYFTCCCFIYNAY